MAAALILLALGAEEETIKQDYMLSNIYLEEYIEDKLDDRKLLVAELYGVTLLQIPVRSRVGNAAGT